MSLLNVTQGIIKRPQKTVIYGSEGIGKSSLAAQFPDPLFIDTEGGTSQLDIKRISSPDTFSHLIDIIDEVAKTDDICQTLVIDTVDWTEMLCVKEILARYKQNSIESFGFGKGYTYLSEEMGRMLKSLDEVIKSGKNVVLIAHAKMRKQELPDEQGAFDRWEMKLSRQVAPLVKEWADLLLFLNYRTTVVKSATGTQKAQGGKRVIYTTHHACWDAKNRHGLPEMIDLSFDELRPIFEGTVKPKTDYVKALHDLMEQNGVTEAQIRSVVPEKSLPQNESLEEHAQKLVKNFSKIVEKINLF